MIDFDDNASSSDDGVDEWIISYLICDETVVRGPPLYRKRWDSHYLIDLATRKGSFLAEMRLSPREFEIIHELL